jgi:hypothetical protein
MSQDKKYVPFDDKLKGLKKSYYQIVYDEEKKKIEKKCIIYGNEKEAELIIILQMEMLGYNAYGAQYNIKHTDIEHEYLPMLGIIFAKDSKTKYSLDVMNKNNTNEMHVILRNHMDHTKELISKIEKYPGNNEILHSLLEYISHERVQKIFD